MDKKGLIKYNPKELISNYEPKLMLKKSDGINTVQKATTAEKEGISLHCKNYGRQTVIDLICMHLISLSLSINTHKSLTDDQILELANYIVSDYYFMSMTEINYVLQRFKKGEFGKINYAVNISDIMNAFKIYDQERTDHYIKAQSEQKINSTEMLHPIQISALKKIKDRMEMNEKYDEEKFKQIEMQAREGNIKLIDTSENTELQGMKKEIEERYGK